MSHAEKFIAVINSGAQDKRVDSLEEGRAWARSLGAGSFDLWEATEPVWVIPGVLVDDSRPVEFGIPA